MAIRITGGRVIDPAARLDAVVDIYITEGRIQALGLAPEGFRADRIVDARGRIVCPGLVDLSARLREPGYEHKATIASETRAAASAGITTLCCPPDTQPVIDTPAVVELIHRRAEQAGWARVVCLGALTQGFKGEQLAELFALKQIGCIGISNALAPIANTEIVRRAWRLVSNGSEGFGRVRLSTSSWDHPHALANYLARGFRVTAVVLQRHEAGTEHRHAVPVDGPPRFLVRPAVAADARPVAGLLDELGYPLPIEGVGTPVAAARRID
jgi:hypothetical protein